MTPEKLIRRTMVILMALTMVGIALYGTHNVANAKVTPLISRVYVGIGWQLEYLPTGVLYDPYGDGSYQRIENTKTVSISTDFSSTVGGFVADGSTQMSMTFQQSWSSSMLSDPAHLGPGKGDLIVGQIWNLTWDVWWVIIGSRPPVRYYEYNLVSSAKVGDFYCSRQDLATQSDGNTHVENKTGQVGAYRNLEVISAGYSIEKSITYSWSGSITTGFDIDLSILGLQGVELSYTITSSGTQSFTVTDHYYDSQNLLKFYENAQSADSNAILDVYSYVFWFSPYTT